MVEALPPHVIVLFGATGDLAKRKLLPGLGYLQQSRFTPDVRIVGTSLEDLSTDEFRALAKSAIDSFGTHKLSDEAVGRASPRSSPTSRRARARRRCTSAVTTAEALLGSRRRGGCTTCRCRRKAAQAVIAMLRDADLVDRSRA